MRKLVGEVNNSSSAYSARSTAEAQSPPGCLSNVEDKLVPQLWGKESVSTEAAPISPALLMLIKFFGMYTCLQARAGPDFIAVMLH